VRYLISAPVSSVDSVRVNPIACELHMCAFVSFHRHGTAGVLPTAADLAAAGDTDLPGRIAESGGYALLAAKLGLQWKSNRGPLGRDYGFGDFDLDFAVELLQYIRASYAARLPGVRSAAVARGDARES
jgi:hypothetical protein